MRRTWMLIAVLALVRPPSCSWTAAAVGASGDRGSRPRRRPCRRASAGALADATPALTLAATPSTVTAGEPAALVVRLGIPGATVQLSRKTATATDFRLVGPLTTDARGVATFRALPGRTTTYRVDYAGDGVAVAAGVRGGHRLGAPARVVLRHREGLPRAARPAVRDRPPGAPRRGGHRRAPAGRRVGRVAHPHARPRLPRADHLARRRRRRLAAARGDAGGLRSPRGRSRVRRVQVVKPNPYNVPIDAKGIVVVDISQYRLRFYSYGTLLRSFACVTGRPGCRRPSATSASTPAGCGRAGRTARGSCPTTRRAPSTAPTSRGCSRSSRATSRTAVPGCSTRTRSGSTTTRLSARRSGTCREVRVRL